MTYQEFLAQVRMTGCKWFIDDETKNIYGRFSGDDRHYCPITGVCKSLTGVYYTEAYWDSAALSLGLDVLLAEKITDAADDCGEPEIRDDLLRMTGLAALCGVK